MFFGSGPEGRSALVAAALAWLLTTALALGLHLSGALDGPEAALLDAWLGLSRAVPRDPRIVLVEVDQEAGARLGKPTVFWTGDYARAVRALLNAGASAVGIDLIMNARREGLPEDSPIRLALEEGETALGLEVLEGRLVLGEFYGSGARTGVDANRRSVETLHFAAEPLRNTAYLNVDTDPDGTVRRVPLLWTAEKPSRTRSMAGRLAELALGAEMVREDGKVTLGGRPVVTEEGGSSLRFRDPGPGYPRLPLSRILDLLDQGKPLPDLSGCLCLLGPGSEEAADLHRTPRDWRGGPLSLTPGLEIHAAALNTLLTSRPLRKAPPGLVLGLVAGVTLVGLLLALKPRPGTGLVLALLGLPAGFAGGLVAVQERDLWVPGQALALAGLVSFGAGYGIRYWTVERARHQIRRLFGRYVSDPVMRELTRNPASLALGGTRRRVTVLFSDINDFTPVCERHAPEEVIRMLNRYFEAMLAIIFRHGGTVKQFVGDEIMVIFGAPEVQEDHAARAVRTAVEMVEALAELARNSQGQPGFYEVKIGIHTGDVVVGNVGAESRTEYAAVGDDVNLAARIEGLAGKLEVPILVSAASRAESEARVPEVEWTSQGVRPFKGKTAQIEVFEVRRRGEGSGMP